MSNSTSIIDYLGEGTLAARPATPPVASGIAALYYATDNNTLYVWNGSAWAAAGGAYSWSDVALTNSSLGTFQGAEPTYAATSAVAVTTDSSAYKFRAVLKGWDSSHTITLGVLDGNTSAASGYYWALQSDGNIVSYKYNGSTSTSLRATGSAFSSIPAAGIIEGTIVFGAAQNYVSFDSQGSQPPSSDNVTTWASGHFYVTASAQAFADILTVQMQKVK